MNLGGIWFWVICGIAILAALLGLPILFVIGFVLGIVFSYWRKGIFLSWL